jgi:hypothetical protein
MPQEIASGFQLSFAFSAQLKQIRPARVIGPAGLAHAKKIASDNFSAGIEGLC